MPLRRAHSIPFLGALIVASAAACSSAGPSPSDAAPSSAAHAGSSPAAATATVPSEPDRVHAFLEDLYPSSAVRHSFHTPRGQTVDCVDFFATRGARTLAAQGHPLTSTPKPPPLQPRRRRDGSIIVDPPRPTPASLGVDEEGHERFCPADTAPQIRLTAEDIERVGGLDAYLAAQNKRPPPRMPKESKAGMASPDVAANAPATASMWPCEEGNSDFHGYAHVLGDVVDKTPGVEFGETTMSVGMPVIPSTLSQDGAHSLGQVWMFGGDTAIDTSGSCTGDTCVHSVEVGWQVNWQITGDFTNPYIFIFSTTTGYSPGTAGCYNNKGTSCTTWVPVTDPPPPYWMLPGAEILYNDTEPQPLEMSALILDLSGNYWVQVGIAGSRYYIGYYAAAEFPIPMATFQVGGEVEIPDDISFIDSKVQMGNGVPGSAGFGGYAAYHHDFDAMAVANGQSVSFWGASSMCASPPPGYPWSNPPYTYDTSAPAGSSSWEDYFYYGGTPPACAPQSCPFGQYFSQTTCQCELSVLKGPL